MDYSRITLSHLVVQHCQGLGVAAVVISPGSRNAPLVMDFTAYPGFKCFSIVDERSAAFFALGIAQQTRKPVALVCTSGSAVVNYFPAITEAFYSQLPLVVISADRPEALIDRGEGQTINQRNIFGTHVLGAVHLSDNDPDFEKASDHLGIVLRKTVTQGGPVHINVPMDEPLYGVEQVPMSFAFDVTRSYLELSPNNSDLSAQIQAAEDYHSCRKKMILIGAMPPNTLSKAVLEQWSNDPSIIVLTESLANVQHPEFISGIDQVISDFPSGLLSAYQPDLLISLGGMIVSKRIKKLLRKMGVKRHWHVGFERPNDTFFALKEHIRLSPDQFFSKAYAFDQTQQQTLSAYGQSSFKSLWLELKAARLKGHEAYLHQAPFCDFTVYQYILAHLPDCINLQVANSAGIRYAQLFPSNKTHNIYCNRGTSGIEGSMSTAVGAAVGVNFKEDKQTVFITGDLSFFYDINALWQNYTPKSFRIIVVNNQGGGIFRILPGAKQVYPFETFLETPHQRNAALLAKEFGFEYTKASNRDELENAFASFIDPSAGPKILEIVTPSTLNDEVLNGYFDFLKQQSGV